MNKIPVYEGLQGNTNIPNVFDEIVDLDLRYAKYIQCNDDSINPNNILNCTTTDMDINTINDRYKNLMGENTDLMSGEKLLYNDWLMENNKETSIQSMQEYTKYLSNNKNGSLTNALDITPISKEIYEKNSKEIEKKHHDIIKIRNELDRKNQELNLINNPVYRDNKAKYDASIYSGVLWTILASSLLYYLFNKL